MGQLKIFQPLPTEEAEVFSIVSADDQDAPAILSFNRIRRFSGHRVMDSVTRARVLHENRQCPHCSHPVVEPLEVNTLTFGNRQLMPIPGTGTLVGFRCESCQAEWSI